ncbi:MAG: hypothetical protein EAZ95_15025, partial [Bacteroidetes bacterium]
RGNPLWLPFFYKFVKILEKYKNIYFVGAIPCGCPFSSKYFSFKQKFVLFTRATTRDCPYISVFFQ